MERLPKNPTLNAPGGGYSIAFFLRATYNQFTFPRKRFSGSHTPTGRAKLRFRSATSPGRNSERRIFASHYQVMITDSPERTISDMDNWDDSKVEQGFAGGLSCRLFGTEADLNDHWIQVIESIDPPDMTEFQRVTCAHFRTETGKIHLMSVVDSEPVISTDVGVGDYSLFFAGSNLGVDQLSLGEDGDLSDNELESRADLERYMLYIVPGTPEVQGKLKDE